MRVCPRCGTSNQDGSAACGACGAPLGAHAPVGAIGQGGGFKQTMVGVVPGAQTPQAVPPAQPPTAQPIGGGAGGRGTMIGMTGSPAPVQGFAPAQPLNQTLAGGVGRAAPAPAPTQGFAPAQPLNQTLAGGVGATPGAGPPRSLNQTLAGGMGSQPPPALGGQPMNRTLAGGMGSQPPPALGGQPMSRTLAGGMGSQPPPAAAPAPAAGTMKQTMLGGMGGAPAPGHQPFPAATPQPAAPAAPGGAPAMKQTMLGGMGGAPAPGHQPFPAAAPQPAAPTAPGGAPAMKQTMLGGMGGAPAPVQPVPGAHPGPAAAPPAAGSMKHTMLGGAGGPPAFAPTQPSPVHTAPGPQQPQQQPFAGTMVYAPGAGAAPPQPGYGATHVVPQGGYAPPAGAPAQPLAGPNQTMVAPQAMQAGPGFAPHGAPPTTPMAASPPMGSGPASKMTMVGGGMPGMGPAAGYSPPAYAAAPPPPEPPAPPKIAGLPRGAIALIGVAGVLAIAALVVGLLWHSPNPVTAAVAVDERGAEQLSLTCEDCADGTTVALGQNRAKFAAKKATLALDKPLQIGANELTVALKRPGIGRDEEVPLTVGVEYRVRGDLSGLAAEAPATRVLVQATPGSAVIVDGTAVTLDAAGKGEHAVTLGKELEGVADTVVPFEKKLPYTVTTAGNAHRGEVTLRFGIAPLRIDAPGESIVIEQEAFMLSGRTTKDGRVGVAGRPITVDPEGRFAQMMNVSSVGETALVVRADAKDLAPRFAKIRVRRVASLKEAADAARGGSVTDYGALGSATAGQRVALPGEVFEARPEGEVTVILLDAKTGCPNAPCLAKVVYGGRFEAKRGTKIEAFGVFAGMVDGPRSGVSIPHVTAEFVLDKTKS